MKACLFMAYLFLRDNDRGMKNGALWILGDNLETGRHIKKIFDEANLLNPIRLIDNDFDCKAYFQAGKDLPLLILLDLGLRNQKAWDILDAARGTEAENTVRFIALVEASTEALLDRAYDAGVKTYLRKPFTFLQFLERARLSNMQFVIQKRP